MRVLAWPAVCDNPYNEGLYDGVRAVDPSIQIDDFSVTRSWLTRPDLVHVHWPEAAVYSPSVPKAFLKSSMVLATLASHKLRGSTVVWTCHNLKGHERRHPRIESMLRRLFYPMVDGIIHLSEESQRLVSSWPELKDRPSAVVPLSLYGVPAAVDAPSKAEAMAALGLDPDLPVLAFVGAIRPYKNVPTLIEAFMAMDRPAQLLIGGNPFDEAERARVMAASTGVDNVTLDLRWLSDEEITLRVRAADVLVLAYRDVHNSSVALLGVGLERPVVITPVGSLVVFGDQVGPDWVYPLTDPLTGPVMDDITDWAMQVRSSGPELGLFDPTRSAKRTADFYRQVIDRKTSASNGRRRISSSVQSLGRSLRTRLNPRDR